MSTYSQMTVVVFETTEETSLHLYDGDLTKYEGIFVGIENEGDVYNILHDELDAVLGKITDENKLTTKEAARYIRGGTHLVHCGFIF